MLSGLNKIFDRSFVIGFAVPAIAIWVALVSLIHAFGINPAPLNVKLDEPLKDTAVLVVTGFGLAILLMLVNYPAYRLLEGYWHPRRLRSVASIPQRAIFDFWKWRERRLDQKLKRLGDFKALAEKRAFLNAKLDAIAERFANLYPANRNHILPMGFGNVIRAFEDYSTEVYGVSAVEAWPRLNGVMTKEFRELIDSTRACVDFWLNLVLGGVLITAVYFTLRLRTGQEVVRWVPYVALATSVVAYFRAKACAVDWGAWVKSAFDVFLPDLCKKMGFTLPNRLENQRRLWRSLSQGMVYRNAKSFSEADRYRAVETAPAVGVAAKEATEAKVEEHNAASDGEEEGDEEETASDEENNGSSKSG